MIRKRISMYSNTLNLANSKALQVHSVTVCVLILNLFLLSDRLLRDYLGETLQTWCLEPFEMVSKPK